MLRTYTELMAIEDFYERYRYLRIGGAVGEETFGFKRPINQDFYWSKEWRRVRREVIVRDYGCDMGHDAFPIKGNAYVHHMNPIGVDQILNDAESLLDPEQLITVSHMTHNAIHYGDESLLPEVPLVRVPYDTAPWRRP